MKIKNSWGVLAVVAWAVFLALVNTTALNLSLSALTSDLQISLEVVYRVVVGYLLVLATSSLVSSYVSAFFGRQKVFVLGLVSLGLGAMGVAWSVDLVTLALGMFLLGVGGGMVLVNAAWLLRKRYRSLQLSRAYQVVNLSGLLAIISGLLISGLLTFYLDWRWFFKLELLALVLVSVFLSTVFTKEKLPTKRRFDWLGAVFYLLGLSAFVSGVMMVRSYGLFFSSQLLLVNGVQLRLLDLSLASLLFGLGTVFGLSFLVWELYLWGRRRVGLVKPTLFFAQTFREGLIIRSLYFTVLIALWFILPLYLQVIPGFNLVQINLVLLPAVLGVVASALGLFSRLSYKDGLRLGLVLNLIGLLILVGSFSTKYYGWFFLSSTFLGLGMGLLVSKIASSELADVKFRDLVSATGTLLSFQFLTGVMSLAVFGSFVVYGLEKSQAFSLVVFKIAVLILAFITFLGLIVSAVFSLKKKT